MAIIYGIPGALKDFLSICDSEITCTNDVKKQLKETETQSRKDRKKFFEKIDDRIQQENERIKEIYEELVEAQSIIGEKIERLEDEPSQKPWKIQNYIKIVFTKKSVVPKKIDPIKNCLSTQKTLIEKLKEDPESVFQSENSESSSRIKYLENLLQDPRYFGAIGEEKTLKTLTSLNDDYHVLCDVQIRLSDYIWYNGKKNLKSAQIDFVVVGPTGIYAIEVKNWSNQLYNNNTDFTPHEQVQRAGKVLWVHLSNKYIFHKPHVTNIVVPVQYNMNYQQNFKNVFVKNLYSLNGFIENGKYQTLNKKQIEKSIKLISPDKKIVRTSQSNKKEDIEKTQDEQEKDKPAVSWGEKKRYCIYCGEKISLQAEYCHECGKDFSNSSIFCKSDESFNKEKIEVKKFEVVIEKNIRYCIYCGEKISLQAEYCHECGKKLLGGKMEKYCYHCGELLKKEARFCEQCGFQTNPDVKLILFCENCGNPAVKNAKFCEKCGQRLLSISEQRNQIYEKEIQEKIEEQELIVEENGEATTKDFIVALILIIISIILCILIVFSIRTALL